MQDLEHQLGTLAWLKPSNSARNAHANGFEAAKEINVDIHANGFCVSLGLLGEKRTSEALPTSLSRATSSLYNCPTRRAVFTSASQAASSSHGRSSQPVGG